jgi:hypothetical protein
MSPSKAMTVAVATPGATEPTSQATPGTPTTASGLPETVTASGISVTLDLVDTTHSATRFNFSLRVPDDAVAQQFGNVLGPPPAKGITIDGMPVGPNDPFEDTADHGPGQPTMTFSLTYHSAFPANQAVTLTIPRLWMPTQQVSGPWTFQISPEMVAAQPLPTPASDVDRFIGVSVAEAQRLVAFPIVEPNPLPDVLTREEFNVTGYAIGSDGSSQANYIMLNYPARPPASEQGVMVVETSNAAAVPIIKGGSISLLLPGIRTRTLSVSPGSQSTLTIASVSVARFEVASSTSRQIYLVWTNAGVSYYILHIVDSQSAKPLVTDADLQQMVTSIIEQSRASASASPTASDAATPSGDIDDTPGIAAVTPLDTPGPDGARITAESVRSYLQTHAAAPGQITDIPNIQFFTNQEAAKHFTWYEGNRSPNSLICIATVLGHFTVDGPPGTPDRVGSTAYVIFDAVTGNLLGDSVQVDGLAP